MFIGFAHLMAVAAIVYMAAVHFSWWTVGLGLLWFALCGMGITGGYHRLFAHKSYQASAPVRAFYLLFGAAAVQNSALKWSSDHRRHHAHVDGDGDPYSINEGFLWAHIGWVLRKNRFHPRVINVADLKADVLMRLQDRYYLPIAIFMGAILPGLIGLAWGDFLGAFLVAGFLRLVIEWHATFFVNSLAHTLGSQPYCRKGSARDSFVTALLTLGEGYHNFHHRFQADYRNGVRWYQLDPTKWFVWTLSRLGQTWDLRRTPKATIQKAIEEVRQERMSSGRAA